LSESPLKTVSSQTSLATSLTKIKDPYLKAFAWLGFVCDAG